jgi:hypothetical protein
MATARPRVFPVTSLGAVLLMLAAGLLATLAFGIYAPALAPSWRLAPEPLATQSLEALFGPFKAAAEAGTILHWVTGILLYPLLYAFVALPLARIAAPGLPWIVAAVLYGVVLWAFALFVVAHLVAGDPPFLGFTAITWSALGGHVLYALVLGAVLSPQR